MDQVIETGMTDLIALLPAVPTVTTFTDEKEAERLYASIQKIVDDFKPDTATKTGRDAIKSLAFKVARVKTAIDKQGLTLTEGWRKDIGLVNESRKKIEARLEELQARARKPYDDWEAAEKLRTDKHQAALDRLLAFISTPAGHSSSDLQDALAAVESTVVDASWEEFEDRAAVAKEDATSTLTRLIAVAEKSEADARELEELRAAKAKLEQEKAEQAAADEAKRIEAQRVENERIAEEKRQADIAQAAKDAADKAAGEAEQRIADAERRAKLAEEQAARDIADAKAEADRKAEAEQKRLADAAKAEADEQRRREEDREHRKTVNNSIISALIEASAISDEQAMQITVALVKGLVPNVTLKY